MSKKTLLLQALLLMGIMVCSAWAQGKIQVVTTLPDYAWIARYVGGDRVEVHALVRGDQDAHFVRPKPSFAVLMRNADLFVTTGLDLELWVPSLMDMANNPRIRSGQAGYVAAYDGIHLLEKPSALTRSEGGLHIYGNPHINTSPLNVKVIAANITTGLCKASPADADLFRSRERKLEHEIDQRVFGAELVGLMGGDMLTRLSQSGNLISFLKSNEYQGRKLIDYLGGWLGQGMEFRGRKIVVYHKGWAYFVNLFGLEEIGTVEPKPGIPPSPRHIEQLVDKMRSTGTRVILAASYFDAAKVERIAARVGGVAVIVPYYVGGMPGVDSVFSVYDYWITHLRQAYETAQQAE